jgi:LAGLIDADG DNA endonuclease family protein
MWTIAELSYLAGIIDGEGSIYIQSRKRSYAIDYFPRFQIVNTDKKLMDWIYSKFGGNLFQKNRIKHNPKWRLQYEWFTTRKLMDQLLELIIPYLICKKEHAQIMLEFRKTFLQKTSYRVSGEVLSFRNECLHKLKVLNKRGIN